MKRLFLLILFASAAFFTSSFWLPFVTDFIKNIDFSKILGYKLPDIELNLNNKDKDAPISEQDTSEPSDQLAD